MSNKKFKSLVSDSVLYAIATGLNRGALLLIFPILLTFLTIEEYGIFTLTFSVSQMLIPFLTISGTAGILREGASSNSIGVYLLEKFIYIVFFNFLILLSLFYLFNNFLEEWILYSILFGALNAIYELFLVFYRIIENKKLYFLLTLIKVTIIFSVVIFAKYQKYTLVQTFEILIVGQSLLVLFMLIVLLKKYIDTYIKKKIQIINVLQYTVFIIPHGLALWVMNSSDKLIIKHYLGNNALGIYSIAYTIASVQLLINSGISISLPQNIYKDYAYWMKSKPRMQVLTVFSFATVCLSLILLIGLKVDMNYWHIVSNTEQIINLLQYIIPGLFLAGIYQFYSIFIFYHKKTKNIFYIGIIVAFINIIINLYIIPRYGIMGAAMTTFFTYILYVSSIIYFAIRLDKRLKNGIIKELFILFLSSLMLGMGIPILWKNII